MALPGNPVKEVLIVEDSALLRKHLAHLLESDGAFRVVGKVANGEEACAFLAHHAVSVVTMDIHMPGMGGFEATRRIMETAPVPIVIVSACWEPEDVEETFRAMEAGAVAIVSTPKMDAPEEVEEFINAVHQAAEARVKLLRPRSPAVTPREMGPPRSMERGVGPSLRPLAKGMNSRVVALGASTGGPMALRHLLGGLSPTFPWPVLVVQHMTQGFSEGFVRWLNEAIPLTASLARHGEEILPGRVLVAPEGNHMEVRGGGVVVLSQEPPEHGVRPSVSRLFRSLSRVYGPEAVGVLLTGMGIDGAEELGLIRAGGGVTFAQDKESAVVWGMPGEAVRRDGATHVLSPQGVARVLVRMAEGADRKGAP